MVQNLSVIQSEWTEQQKNIYSLVEERNQLNSSLVSQNQKLEKLLLESLKRSEQFS